MRLVIACLLLLGAVILVPPFTKIPSSRKLAAYKSKSLEEWFYGSRRDFFQESTRNAAQEAIAALGTNSLPFLFSRLKERSGNGMLYFTLYRKLPAVLQTKLPYPISGDDIKAITLAHLGQFRFLPKDQVPKLADCVPKFKNPRLRMMGLNLMSMKYQSHPAFWSLCRALLDDPHPGVQLESAIWLGQSALSSDPGEPRLFPILATALENQEQRKVSLDVAWYGYQQQPPGGSGALQMPKQFGLVDPDLALRERIISALDRLESRLTTEEKNRLKQLRQTPSAKGAGNEARQN